MYIFKYKTTKFPDAKYVYVKIGKKRQGEGGTEVRYPQKAKSV
jgi:hypothetical protein